ncbi:hypothetical protein MMC32_002345, partial [Xylographa parallela]|nr:hypothetical protein [Xylographa parallela]
MAVQQLPLRLRPLSSAIRHPALPRIRFATHRSASTVSEPAPTSSSQNDTPSATSSSHDTPFPTASQIASYDP